MAKYCLIAVTLMLGACSADVDVHLTEHDPAVLDEVDASRFRAMIAADAAALDRVLADDLVYTHTTGRVDTKQAFIDSLTSGNISYEAISTRDTVARVYGDVAVITGSADFEVSAGSQQLAFPIRFTEVYEWSDGRWQLVAWQSTRLPE